MSRKQYKEHKQVITDPNRLLDIKIGITFFGMRIAKRPSGNPKYKTAYRLHNKRNEPVGWPSGGLFGWGWGNTPSWFDCPRFTTDHNEAWKIVAEMAIRGCRLELKSNYETDGPRRCTASFIRKGNSTGIASHASEAPTAICLAALAEVKDEEVRFKRAVNKLVRAGNRKKK